MKIGKTKVDVLCGDIIKLNVEAVVNPANNMLWLGGGVSSSIRKAGGESIETEALSMAPAVIGSAVITGAGSLKARWVVHAVISGQDLNTDEKSIRKAVKACLAQANEINCKSIAIPMLDTYSFDVEVHVAARIIVEETVTYLINKNKSLEHVVFVDDNEGIKDIFQKTLLEIFTKHG